MKKKERIYAVGFGLFLLIFWQMVAWWIGKSYLLPSPMDVLDHLNRHWKDIFLKHLPATMEVVVIGFTLAVLFGFAMALLMDLNKTIEKAVYPILTITQTIPVMCIAPVFVLWFGYTIKMRVIVVVLMNFFAVAVNVSDGFKATRIERMDLLKTYGAGRWEQFRYLRFPTALPYLFTALKIAVPWSIIGAAVAEWLGAPAGMGTYSRSCMMELDAAGLLAPLFVLTAIALILNALLAQVEKNIITW